MSNSSQTNPNEVPNPLNPNQIRSEYQFVYKNQEYDTTSFAGKHPGGVVFMNHMQDEKQDFTEYFRALHSKRALKILQSMPVTAKNIPESENSVKYTAIKKRVKHLIKPNYFIEVGLALLTFAMFLAGSFTNNWFAGIILLGLAQNIGGWIGHSQSHSRDLFVNKCGSFFGAICIGLSSRWWNRKHNLHHMFTNNFSKDQDIQHDYKRYLFQFLFFKWKYDSLVTDFGTMNFIPLVIHQIIVWNQRWWVVVIAWLISGFFTAIVLVGNHEKEMTFKDKITLPFIDHQIETTRNYPFTNVLHMILMGGMQYQTEHHLFPQIPFYHLPQTAKIIAEELKKINQRVKYGSIM